MDELEFETSDGEISYRHANPSELLSVSDEEFSKPIILDLIQAGDMGEGKGSRLLKDFINKMKSEDVDLIYLFAEYDPFYEYDEGDFQELDEEEQTEIQINGLKRLIKFYEKHGFEVLGGNIGVGTQVDMALVIGDNMKSTTNAMVSDEASLRKALERQDPHDVFSLLNDIWVEDDRREHINDLSQSEMIDAIIEWVENDWEFGDWWNEIKETYFGEEMEDIAKSASCDCDCEMCEVGHCEMCSEDCGCHALASRNDLNYQDMIDLAVEIFKVRKDSYDADMDEGELVDISKPIDECMEEVLEKKSIELSDEQAMLIYDTVEEYERYTQHYEDGYGKPTNDPKVREYVEKMKEELKSSTGNVDDERIKLISKIAYEMAASDAGIDPDDEDQLNEYGENSFFGDVQEKENYLSNVSEEQLNKYKEMFLGTTESATPSNQGNHYSDPMIWQAALEVIDGTETDEELEVLAEEILAYGRKKFRPNNNPKGTVNYYEHNEETDEEFEYDVEVSVSIQPAEPDVGIMAPYVEEVIVNKIFLLDGKERKEIQGEEFNKLADKLEKNEEWKEEAAKQLGDQEHDQWQSAMDDEADRRRDDRLTESSGTVVIDEDLGVDFQDSGPWRSYTLVGQGDTLEEFLDDAAIFEIDQDGGSLNDYSIFDAGNEVEKAAIEMIMSKFGVTEEEIYSVDLESA